MRAKPGLHAQVIGQLPQRGGRPQANERLVRYLGKAKARLFGERMIARQREPEGLDRYPAGAYSRITGPAGANLKVRVTAIERRSVKLVADLG